MFGGSLTEKQAGMLFFGVFACFIGIVKVPAVLSIRTAGTIFCNYYLLLCRV